MDANAPSRAQAFFQEILTGGTEFIRQLVSEETPAYESEFLDFKGGHIAEKSEERKLRTEWAKCLSCFANSDGGVVVFGIHAPANKAKSLQAVGDIDGLVKKLNEMLPRVTEPPVQKVEIKGFPNQTGSKDGFVACLIPASTWRPHQTKVSGEPDQFYMRTGDNCTPCNLSTLRALFQPQLVSRFEVCFRWFTQGQDGDDRPFYIHCWLINHGPSTADDVVLNFHVNPVQDRSVRFDKSFWNTIRTHGYFSRYAAISPIHPMEEFDLFRWQMGKTDKCNHHVLNSPRFHFEIVVWARNQTPVYFDKVVTQFDIQVEETAKFDQVV